MLTKDEVLQREWDASEQNIQVAIILNCGVDKIKKAMDEYAKQMALAFYEHEEGIPADSMSSNYDWFIKSESKL